MSPRTTLFTMHPVLLLLLGVLLAGGCSWTSSMFGAGDSAKKQTEQPQQAEDAKLKDAPVDGTLEMGLGREDQVQRKKSLVPPPERGKEAKVEYQPLALKEPAKTAAMEQKPAAEPATPPPASPEAAKPEPEKSEPAAEKEPAPAKEKETLPKDAEKQIAAVAPKAEPRPEPETEPQVKIEARGRVPIERPGSPGKVIGGDIEYKTAAELHAAVQRAIEREQFLGYTDPFDAFPVLSGEDTISAAFIPVEYPNHKVFYHSFYQPGEPFHQRVYGYTVIDMRSNEDFGHFDGDADGIFEQKTLDPKIVIDDYIRTSGTPTLKDTE